MTALGPSQVVATVDVSPVDLRPEASEARDAAALCLHGLTGTPYEVRPLADALVARGVRAQSIWMAGHNGTVDDLAHSTHEEWVARARQAFHALRAEYARVFVVGMSMGGLVSLRLAETEPVDAVVSVGAPLEFSPAVRRVLPILKLFKKGRRKTVSGVAEPDAQARHPYFPLMPYASVLELIALQDAVRRDLGRISVPILVAHGALDKTANPEDAARIFEGVATAEADKELMSLARSAHIATVDYDGPDLARAVADFLVARAPR